MVAAVPVEPMRGPFTIRIELETSDMLMWMRFRGAWSAGAELVILDFWSSGKRLSITITNRSGDLPSWFRLNPTETSGRLSENALRDLEAGYKPEAPVEGPHIWRVLAGDRLVHCGRPKGSEPTRIDGLIRIYDFNENAAVTAENEGASVEDWIAFGVPDHAKPTSAELRAGRAALAAVESLGAPSEVSDIWTLSC